jgi:hypothetical protein
LGIAVTATYSGSTTITPTSYTVTGLVNGETISGISSAIVISANVAANGSNYVIAMTTTGGTASLSNYAIAPSYSASAGSTQNTATIAAKALIITANAVTAPVYGTAYSLGTAAFTDSGLVGGDVINSVTLNYGSARSVSATTNAGTYIASIVPSSAVGTRLGNYAITYVAGDLTVNKAALTITPNAYTTTYSGSTLDNAVYSQNTANYGFAGYKNADSVVNVPVTLSGIMNFAASTTTVVQDAGTYGLAAGTLTANTSNSNYNIVFANGANNAYVINPATLNVSASKVYDGNATFGASAVSAISSITNQAVSLSGSATANSANVIGVSSLNTAGLTITNSALANNYILPSASGNVAITPAPITVSISTQSKAYDSTNTAALTSGNSSNAGSYVLSGFVSGQGAYSTHTNAIYNSPNGANANSVSTTLSGANYIAIGSTNLSN